MLITLLESGLCACLCSVQYSYTVQYVQYYSTKDVARVQLVPLWMAAAWDDALFRLLGSLVAANEWLLSTPRNSSSC